MAVQCLFTVVSLAQEPGAQDREPAETGEQSPAVLFDITKHTDDESHGGPLVCAPPPRRIREVGGDLVGRTAAGQHVIVLVLPRMERPLGVLQIDKSML